MLDTPSPTTKISRAKGASTVLVYNFIMIVTKKRKFSDYKADISAFCIISQMCVSLQIERL